MKKIIILFISILILGSCSTSIEQKNKEEKLHNINITTTIVPLGSIATFIGGEQVKVDTIIQPGVSPHTFDLKPSDIKLLTNSDIIFSTGLDLDSFIIKEKYSKHIELKNYVTLLEGHEHNHADEDNHEHDEHHDEHEENDNHVDQDYDDHKSHSDEIYFDPHLWLSLENGNKIAKVMKDNFIALDPNNIKIYESNYAEFIKKSDTIKKDFLNNINGKNISYFIVFHEAYNYLFEEFSIDEKYVIVLEETAGREPSVGEMKNIIDTIQSNNIKVLYKEPQFESKLITILQSEEYNLTVNILDPLGQAVDKNSYFDNIEQNLNNLIKTYE